MTNKVGMVKLEDGSLVMTCCGKAYEPTMNHLVRLDRDDELMLCHEACLQVNPIQYPFA